MGVLVAAGVLLVAAAAWGFHRATEPPIMRRRVNAGSDRYLAERDREGGDASGGDWDGDDGDGD